jgi:hypothetical protein
MTTNTHTDTDPRPEGAPRPVVTIIHTAADGTVLDGLSKSDTRKGGHVRAVLDAQAWTWRPAPGWFQRQSRDRPARIARIQDTARRLRALGYQVDVHIDEHHRGMAEQETERAHRMRARAETLHSRADRLQAHGSARREQAETFFRSIPLGEPVHGPRDRTRREKEHDRLARGMQVEAAADRAAAKAASAAAHMGHRYAPQMVTNRIARLETQASKLRLYLDEGDYEGTVPRGGGQPDRVVRAPITDPGRRARIDTQLADLEQQLAHWRGVHQQQIAEGTAHQDYGPADVTVGGYVRTRYGWHTIARVNKVTVSVHTPYSHTKAIRFTKILAIADPPRRRGDNGETG